MWLILLGLILLILLFVYKRHAKYWKSRGVPGPTPLPWVGNLLPNIIGKKSAAQIYGDIYKEYEEYPFVGIFRMGEPCLLLRDADVIKNIILKDFNHFINNDIFVDKELDPLLGRNPFVLKGEEWKKSRQFLSPGFAPAKIKSYFPLVEKVGNTCTQYLGEHQGESLNVKDICGRFTCDAVALCAFGMENNSFENPNSQFLGIVRKFVTPDSLQALKIAISFVLPNFFKIKLIPKSFDDDVVGVTKEIMKYRQESNIKVNDYFDSVSQSKTDTTLDIAGHVAGFIVDGFETTSTAMTFMIYELAANPQCQIKLREEINSVLETHDGKFSHDALKDMVYLEACALESLRLHPPLAQLGKTCNQRYTISSTNDDLKHLSVTLEPGQTVIIPLLGLHKDPKYFPSPDKFMPERFLEKNESVKYIFLPFGNGPRACLGSRFGLLESKVGIYSIIKDFEINVDEKMKLPLKYDPLYFLVYPKGGAWINCRKITV